MKSINERLVEERKRLGLKQVDIASSTGVTERTQQHYEAGSRTPDAEYLAKAAKLGIDVQYVVTGQRSTN
jgi:transcriptional regulator with XRE-family HTH domain